MKHIVAIVAAVLVATGSYAPKAYPAGHAYADASAQLCSGVASLSDAAVEMRESGIGRARTLRELKSDSGFQSAPPQLQALEVGAIKIVYDKPPLSKAETMQSPSMVA